MKVYMIATIKEIESKFSARMNGNFGIAEVYNSRTIGYATTLEEAKHWVETNACDIHEDYYKYVVIEDVAPGIYTSTDSTSIWYKWSKAREKYIPIEKPTQLNQIVGFTIG